MCTKNPFEIWNFYAGQKGTYFPGKKTQILVKGGVFAITTKKKPPQRFSCFSFVKPCNLRVYSALHFTTRVSTSRVSYRHRCRLSVKKVPAILAHAHLDDRRHPSSAYSGVAPLVRENERKRKSTKVLHRRRLFFSSTFVL